ncbi:quinone oxidoreductase family protein [Tepidamorphus sp. 3E244]|uniref:quinone oxidoreductase family protein n=1 Tax=Tepidamorphus sp. 3E244 TaxID=3385498 RepID=UPI0038FC4DC2
MPNAIQIHEAGGPEVMKFEQVSVGEPGEGEVRIRHTAIGLNYIDVYFRSGLYPAPQLPFTPGMEGAGVVEKVGPGVSGLKEGDRVAYAMVLGAYAEMRNVPAAKLVKIPEGVTDEQAASMMLKGLTAYYLLHRTYKVQKGDTILMHAAAGGVGLIVCQWANALGATVIGTAGSDEKCELAKAHGAHHVINYRTEDFVERVAEITDGKKCAVVYDGVGKDTFTGSLDCLQPFGMMVTFGNASGPVDPLNLLLLSQKGSLFVTRPTLATHTASRDLMTEAADGLFAAVSSGQVKIEVNQTYKLADAAQAHTDLEGRKTTGASVFVI